MIFDYVIYGLVSILAGLASYYLTNNIFKQLSFLNEKFAYHIFYHNMFLPSFYFLIMNIS